MSDSSPSRATAPGLMQLLSAEVLANSAEWRRAFAEAEPFRYAVIDGFFESAFAEQLLARFPAFDPALAKNEIYGGVWGKAVNTKLREIDPVYQRLYELVASPPFLDCMGEITGIPGLMFDPAFYGGGTHENLHGQDLDPHVDFNYDQAQQLHRRLNLIVYLNKDWRTEWGGALELHSNPRKPEENRVRAVDPVFNRAVLFETNEHSWHGFPRIELPEGERRRSRKSISIYLYTRERPAHEIAPLHGTFYVQRPLPEWVQPGHVLSEEDCAYLRHAVDRRDKWIESYQKMELAKSGQIAENAAYIRDLLSRVRAPLTGYVLQEGCSNGLYSDGWSQPRAAVPIRPLKPVTSIRVRGWRPDFAPAEAKVSLRIDGKPGSVADAPRGLFETEIRAGESPLENPFLLEIECDQRAQTEGDNRDLAFVLIEIRAEHD
jgi:hypothetical protein